MPKVFGVGLSKTGTLSLHRVFEILGLRSCHLRHAGGPKHNQVVVPEDMADYDAGTDINIAGRFEWLDTIYPDPLFVYTVRELNAWLRSIHSELYATRAANGLSVGLRGVTQNDIGLGLAVSDTYGGPGPCRFDSAWWIGRYIAHEGRVRNHFYRHGTDRLLVLNVCAGEGWERLCPFLGLPVPDVPFPHEHRSHPAGADQLPKGLLR